MQKEQFSIFMLYFDHIFSDILQNAPFRSQIFKIFFASGGKGALFPLTKILRTFLAACVLRISYLVRLRPAIQLNFLPYANAIY